MTEQQLQIIADFESNFEAEQLADIQSIIYFLEDGEALAKFYDLEERDKDQDEPSEYENEVQRQTEFLRSYYEAKLEQEFEVYNTTMVLRCLNYKDKISAAKTAIEQENIVSEIRDELHEEFPYQDHHGIYEDISNLIKCHGFWK